MSIVDKQAEYGWGKSVVESLSNDLQKEFPGVKGFSNSNLWRIKSFVSEYHDNTVDGIAIFGTNLAFIGKTIDTTPFIFASITDISLSTYLSHWPMDYSTLRNAHAALLITKEAEARDSIVAGTFFPHSEFADL